MSLASRFSVQSHTLVSGLCCAALTAGNSLGSEGSTWPRCLSPQRPGEAPSACEGFSRGVWGCRRGQGWGMLTQPLLSQLQAAQARAAQLEQCPAERSIVSRQEARIRDLESQLDFQAVQMKRFEVLPSSPELVPGRAVPPAWLWGQEHLRRAGRDRWGLRQPGWFVAVLLPLRGGF